MSIRTMVKVVREGDVIASIQLFGNNILFSEEHLDKLGIENIEEECLFQEQEVDKSVLIECFKEHFLERFKVFNEYDWEQVIGQYKDINSLLYVVPDYTMTGSFAITLNELLKYGTYEPLNHFHLYCS